MTEPAASSRRWLLVAPLVAAAGVGTGFYAMLQGMNDGSFDPRGVPSALVGRPIPRFVLPPIPGREGPGLATADLMAPATPVVVNFWASWCVPCIIEHPQLMRLQREGVPVFGVNYKDQPDDALAFLERRGNPYDRLGADGGRVAIEWGVYGVPETYVVDRQGVIRWRWAGPVTPEVYDQILLPLLRGLG